MSFENIVLVVGGTLTGLFAGLLYAFNVAFIPSLRRVSAKSHIATMQELNTRIQNPVFFLSFFGPTLLLPLAAYLHRGASYFPLLVAAAALHILGGNGVTAAGNIPLNEKLDQVKLNEISDEEAERIRQEYMQPGSAWMRFHNLRTLAEIAAAALVLMVCLSKAVSNE